MSQLSDYFNDLRVLVWGLGREGMSSLEILSELANVRRLAVMDSDDVVVKSVVESSSCNFEVVKSTEEFRNFDIILKAPGISVHNLREEIRADDFVKISSQVDVFLQLYGAQTIGITGTKGKSTTASLIHHVLKKCGYDVVLGGNIGIPVFELVEQITSSTKVVLELSSHQLEFLNASPHIALLLNLFQDHLDHYEDLGAYHNAKLNIVKYQKLDDYLVFSKELLPKVQEFLANRESNQKLAISCAQIEDLKINHSDELLQLGFQNASNVVFAYRTLVDILGVQADAFFEQIVTFKTLEHRMEHFATVDGVEYYDDSISTIPEATILAVQALGDMGKSVGTVILGGMERGIDYTKLVEFLSISEVLNIILLPNTGARLFRYFKELDSQNTPRIYNAQSLEEAVDLAKTITPRKTACLLSPAAASYGIFKNFQERGDAFKMAVCGVNIIQVDKT
ncbi:MAG: UDP-N-acetylmuramoyl-L-alanine--D-glutamate ligase [Candidatus Ancillula sp.]|nr:UDP-N-acetylmuramoyl-L-alanine--D-glutamate ligase [Candidatus Ancillula sp.]